MDYQIIPITLEHVKGFHAAVDSVARERKFLAFLEGPPLQMSYDFVKENIEGGWPQVVAISNNKVIGWCDISSLHRQSYAHCGELGIGVLKEFRGKGIGEALMRAALDKAKQKGLTRIELSVFDSNKGAMLLYHKLGFEVEGKKRKAVLIDGKYDDLICMALLFE